MMNVTDQTDWKKDFGLEDRKPPYFFSSVEQLDRATTRVPHPLVIRRAFKQLGIEGTQAGAVVNEITGMDRSPFATDCTPVTKARQA